MTKAPFPVTDGNSGDTSGKPGGPAAPTITKLPCVSVAAAYAAVWDTLGAARLTFISNVARELPFPSILITRSGERPEGLVTAATVNRLPVLSVANTSA